MRKTLIALAALASFISTAAYAGPPCNIHVGGLCGADYDSWMQTWHRTNPGKTIEPVSPGGYGIYPNGQIFYPNNGGIGGGVVSGGYYDRFGHFHHHQQKQTVVIGRQVIIGWGHTCTVRNAYGQVIAQYDGSCPR